jgi:HSP20 family protein
MEYRIPTRWRHAVEHLRDEIHRVLERWFHRQQYHDTDAVGRYELPVSTGGMIRDLPTAMVTGGPVIDIEETANDVVVAAELPGLEKEDITVEMHGDWLRIRGEKKQESEQRGEGYYYAERRYGAFSRTIALPCEVDADQATANYKNGVLKITLPKTAAAKSRRIDVEVKT